MQWFDFFDGYNTRSLKGLIALSKAVESTNNPELAYQFAYTFSQFEFTMQRIVINSKSAKYLYLFAKDIEGCHRASIQEHIFNLADLDYITRYICYVSFADVQKGIDIIIKEKSINHACILIKKLTLDYETKNQLQDVVLKSKSPIHMAYISNNIHDDHILNMIQDSLIESKNVKALTSFAVKCKTADIELIEKVVLDNGSYCEIIDFATKIKKSNANKLLLYK